MAVNNAFYSTLNELMQRATNGTIAEVIDYNSFVDGGKTLAAMTSEDLANNFLTPLMNKIQRTINDTPSYRGDLVDMYHGTLDYGVLEIIMGDFYEAQASTFDGEGTLVEGTSYTDQFTVNLPKTKADYYTLSDSWQKTITIRDTDLRGAFATPDAMDRFIRGKFLDIANSNELHKENARLGLLASTIALCANATENSTDETAPAINYNLVAIYNRRMGTNLSSADALYDDKFVLFAVGTIRDISELMRKPSSSFSINGDIDTFTPREYLRTKINAIFDKQIRASLVNAYNKEDGMITNAYEVVPYWQNISDRLTVTLDNSNTTSVPVIAVLYDDRAMGEMTQLEEVATDRNGMRRYTNYHYQFNNMYYAQRSANTVIFTLGDESGEGD